jgi:hypothetical protein
MDTSWFEAMADDARNRPDVYRRLGFGDLRLVVEETDDIRVRRFGLILDGYDVSSAGEVEDVESFHPDATISGPRETWNEMAANIVNHGRADLGHTLNALSIAETPLKVSSPDPLGRDKFFRYAETLQTLFDSLAKEPIAI